MLVSSYFDAIQSKIAEIRQAESENIEKAAGFCAECIAAGGVVHIHDTGHMLGHELIGRAGGLVGLSRFTFAMNVDNPNLFRANIDPAPPCIAETIALALKKSNVRPGDVMFIGSVSGKSEGVVELAIQAGAMGATTIAMTALAYSSKLSSQHPSGRKLYEVAEMVLDNHAPYGDAMVAVDGLDVNACPASGIGAAVIMWAISAGIIEDLLAKGITPTVYRSVNAPDGPEDVKEREARYKELGY